MQYGKEVGKCQLLWGRIEMRMQVCLRALCYGVYFRLFFAGFVANRAWHLKRNIVRRGEERGFLTLGA